MELFGKTLGFLGQIGLRFLQFALAIAVCGLYGVDLHRASSEGKYMDSKWVPIPHPCIGFLQSLTEFGKVYAEVIGGISALTAVLYFVPPIAHFRALFLWDFALFVLWVALFGVFGSMYIKESSEGNADIQRMKNTVWVDLASALLWLIGSIFMFTSWWRHRERNSLFTGRAKVSSGL